VIASRLFPSTSHWRDSSECEMHMHPGGVHHSLSQRARREGRRSKDGVGNLKATGVGCLLSSWLPVVTRGSALTCP
jgi:hypothetical protein